MDTKVTEADLAWMAGLAPEWREDEAASSEPELPDDAAQAAAIVSNALAAERAARGGGETPAHGATSPPVAPAVGGGLAASDADWFAANPDRTLRIRERRPEDRLPHWAEGSSGTFAVVHRPLYGRSVVSPADVAVVALEAVSGAMPADTDAAGFAALRANRARVAAAQ